jgi:hypothetical protein
MRRTSVTARTRSENFRIKQDHIRVLFLEVGNNERHFNQIQGHYRTMASTWLLGLFVAAGFLLSQEEGKIPYPPGAVIGALGVLAAIGILSLWVLDVFVYQRLLRGWFNEGVRLESENPWLPPVRKALLRDSWRGQGLTFYICVFYAAAYVTCLLVSCAGLLSVLDGFAVRGLVVGLYSLLAVSGVLVIQMKALRIGRNN